MESHAGRALYDLGAPEAAKTGEAARGIGRAASLPEPLAGVLARVRAAHGGAAYPGSPLVAQEMLRGDDRMVLCELHPAEHAALRAAMPGAEIHRRDGHEGVLALSPPTPRRGLVLIDPSYEVKDEYARTADTARKLLARWPEAVVMVWYPLLPEARHEALTGPLAALPGLRVDEVAFAERPARGMWGSGLLFANLPWGADAALDAAQAGLSGLLA